MSTDAARTSLPAHHCPHITTRSTTILASVSRLKQAHKAGQTSHDSPVHIDNIMISTLFHSRGAVRRPAALLMTGTLLLLCFGLSPLRAAPQGREAPSDMAASSQAQTWVSGEVRRVDVALGRLTVRHADIPHLEMGAMTMVFRLKPGVLTTEQLKAVRPGDRIEFQAEAPQGQLTITALRRSLLPAESAASGAASAAALASAAEHHH